MNKILTLFGKSTYFSAKGCRFRDERTEIHGEYETTEA